VALALGAGPGAGQHVEGGLRAVAALTAAAPTPLDRGAAAELRLLHPIAGLEVASRERRLRLIATANLEGWTLPNGELALGAWGEGFVDRRHPHTFLHELILAARVPAGAATVTLAGGKGFVPFGTDDPMTRPALRYPVNHHLSQILERALLMGALRAGPLLAEVAWFNGDEPDAPDQAPRLDRFGDSWAARLTLAPRPGLELQGSYASVHSPEHRGGAGPEQVKWSASARWLRTHGRTRIYALAEWARTSEAQGFFVFRSALVEAAVSVGPHRPYVRLERTERPEEERVSDYRSTRPKRDDAVLAITRWTIATLGYGVRLRAAHDLTVQPFVEAALGHVAAPGAVLFDPTAFYGGTTVRAITVGFRMAIGREHHAMGRYADAAEAGHGH
jgi:hypothetical protein